MSRWSWWLVSIGIGTNVVRFGDAKSCRMFDRDPIEWRPKDADSFVDYLNTRSAS